jgi:hypothetical protein
MLAIPREDKMIKPKSSFPVFIVENLGEAE